jgi:hypothetical protein
MTTNQTTTQDGQGDRPDTPTTACYLFANSEDLDAVVSGIVDAGDEQQACNNLADLLISLREALSDPAQLDSAALLSELDSLIERTFRGSELYELALEIYRQRYHIIGGRPPVEVLRAALEQGGVRPRKQAGEKGEA